MVRRKTPSCELPTAARQVRGPTQCGPRRPHGTPTPTASREEERNDSATHTHEVSPEWQKRRMEFGDGGGPEMAVRQIDIVSKLTILFVFVFGPKEDAQL